MIMLLLNLLLFTLSAAATNIILPLYVYPGANAANWTSIGKAIGAFPTVQWQIIINPHTGPGTNSSDPYPNADYITGIKTLNRWSNVKLLGYSDTAWGNRNISAVKADINNYAAWAKYGYADISMDGIFFDDVPSIHDFNDHAGTLFKNETYFQEIANYARSTLSPSSPANAPIIFNSGNPGASSFFNYCDTMVEFENIYTTYKGDTTLQSIISDGGTLEKSAVITYNIPDSVTQADIDNIARAMSKRRVQLMGLTHDCCYNVINGTLLTMMASAANSTQNLTSNTNANSATQFGSSSVTTSLLIAGLSIIFSILNGIC